MTGAYDHRVASIVSLLETDDDSHASMVEKYPFRSLTICEDAVPGYARPTSVGIESIISMYAKDRNP